MDSEQLRRRLARELKVEMIHDPIWSQLEEDDFVTEALEELNGGEKGEAWDLIIEAAAKRITLVREMLPILCGENSAQGGLKTRDEEPRRRPGYRSEWRLEDVLLAGEAFSTALAARAADQRSARHVRFNVLGRRLLTPEQAWRFLTSPITRFMPKDDVRTQRLSPLADEARLVLYEGRSTVGHGEWRSIDIQKLKPTSLGKGFSENRDQLNRMNEHRVSIRLERNASFITSEMEIAQDEALRTLMIPDIQTNAPRQLLAWPRTVFDEIYQSVDDLTELYPWDQSDAVLFLLTGRVPPIPAIKLLINRQDRSDHVEAVVNMEVAAWVPGATVLQPYGLMQMLLINKHPQVMGERSLILVKFVENLRVGAKLIRKQLPLWAKMCEIWNSNYADWKFSDRRQMQGRYKQAVERLLLIGTEADDRIARMTGKWLVPLPWLREVLAERSSAEPGAST